MVSYPRVYIPAPPGKYLHHCNAIQEMWRGKQMIYAYCTKPANHWESDDGEHFDEKRKHSWAETIFWDEFERGRSTRAGAVKAAKKVRLCKHCSRPIKTDGSPDACVCKPTGQTKKQGTMFKEDRERAERDFQAIDLAEDIALTEAHWHALEIQAEQEAIKEFM